ncbi:hypothetical protein [Luteolibacter sp. AS25]|uniref:hypothetical protein n=1 Tax=Luteolibacter sp. AS25 TaxID=3135776 RepID=UPI00398A881B
MKKLITIIAAGAFAFVGTTINADARPNGGKSVQHQSTTYVSGYRHGRPVYTQKIFVGYDRHGHPRFEYRTVSAPSRHVQSSYRGHQVACPPVHRNSYDDRRSSGARVSFSFGR